MKPTITLTKGATSITLPAPVGGARTNINTAQVAASTASGEKYIYELGNESVECEFEIKSMTTAEKDALASFFKNTALGMKETWELLDPAGNTQDARFTEPSLVFVQFANNIWDCSFTLTVTEQQ